MEELDGLERYLQRAAVLTWGDALRLDGGHPDKHRVVLAGGIQVLAKPTIPPHERVPPREAAGWLVAKHLGFPGLVAATVVREVPHRTSGNLIESSVQVMWPDDRQWLTPIGELPDDEVWQAAIFDAVVAHSDHGNNNWFGVPAPDGSREVHLQLVDTGNAFDLNPGAAVNSSFYEHHHHDHIPGEYAGGIGRLAEEIPQELIDLLGIDEGERVRNRCAQLSNGLLHIG